MSMLLSSSTFNKASILPHSLTPPPPTLPPLPPPLPPPLRPSLFFRSKVSVSYCPQASVSPLSLHYHHPQTPRPPPLSICSLLPGPLASTASPLLSPLLISLLPPFLLFHHNRQQS